MIFESLLTLRRNYFVLFKRRYKTDTGKYCANRVVDYSINNYSINNYTIINNLSEIQQLLFDFISFKTLHRNTILSSLILKYKQQSDKALNKKYNFTCS